MFFVHIKMNKVPRKSLEKEVILSWKSLENCSQNSVRTLMMFMMMMMTYLYYYYYY